MPTYDYRCVNCELEKEIIHSIKEDPEMICQTCGHVMKKMISKGVQIVFRGAGWTGKNLREKTYREKRQKEMGRKMALNYDIPQIQPNYKGEVCKNWDDAKKLAKADGINPIRYEKQVQTLKKEERRVKDKANKLVKGEG